MKKLLGDGFTTKIARTARSFVALGCPSSTDLPRRTLRYVADQLLAQRREFGQRW
ncbi:hypothetical protein [Streptomyces sp. NPDC056682]|uniref:hypothetical protein n=1 Tax=Streptomyces sp. NPDC056682 TaxID=3345909 RepID=UPI0036CBE84B